MTPEGGPLTDDVSGPRYRLRSSVEAFVDRDGVLCLVRPGERDLVVREPDDADLALVRALTLRADTAEGLARRLSLDRSRVERKLESLVAAEVVIVRSTSEAPPLAGEDAERFARQLPYLADLGDAAALQRELRDSTVVVIGSGGVGTWAIAALACIGVGEIVIVDDDQVALSNLNRQILYTRGAVGTGKAAATARWLRAFDPAIRASAIERRIESPKDVPGVIAGARALVLAADWPPYELARWVNAACIEARMPFVVAGQVPPIVKIGPTYVPGSGPCFACHEMALARDSHRYQDYVAFRTSAPVTTSTLGPASCVIGGLIGLELLHLLTGQAIATKGAALLLDMRSLALRREDIERDSECAACKHLE